MTSTNTYTITEEQRLYFKPTYLYIKYHSVTGLKYFGKTISKNPTSYKGSGVYWTRHIKNHGKEHIITDWYKLFTDIDELVEYAINFSIENDIVLSKEWANLEIENGLNGLTSETARNITKKQIQNGTHPFVGGEIQRKSCNDRVANGTHPWKGDGTQQKILANDRVANGTHNLQKRKDGTSLAGDRVKLGIHNTQKRKDGTSMMTDKSGREIYIEIRELYKELGMKIPKNTYMKSETNLINIKKSLLNHKKEQLLNGTYCDNRININLNKSQKPKRAIYLEVKFLYKKLGMKIPKNTHTRSNVYLETIKNELCVLKYKNYELNVK